ncbi:MAG: MIP/aquaporin family protein [Stagnimonas sp.]|nr:MIP/aquaporin family protein [Stagnimonas sp.]
MNKTLFAEFLGTALLLAVVVGSGIMGARLAEGNLAVALLANSLATGCGLYVLITLLGPISGAHFNPAVTAVFCARGERPWQMLPAYAAAQVAGGVLGVWLTHAMFALPILQTSTHIRSGGSQWLAEAVATFGLVLTILGGLRHAVSQVPVLVAAYITAAYWFTASTSFANPAVTVARALTDTFAGIHPAGIVGFVLAQCVGAALATVVARTLFTD